MCGIVGLVYNDPRCEVETARIERMCDAIVYRGPDERGLLCKGHVGLGMQRLSIIDLSTGSQPIYNEDRTIWVVYNGEIYNFKEVRRALEAQGHQFSTQSDTEIIVHAYEQYGVDCVERFNGMFAFALWDSRQERLLLARDRAGQKPLFYHHTPERLLFASEIKALLVNGDVPRAIHHPSIYHYLSLQYVPGPETILHDVFQLPAGHYAVWQHGNLAVERYWQPDYAPDHGKTREQWRDEVRQTVTAAVERHLVSDVPLGALLSGGVDSSIIVAVMEQIMKQPVKTFSIGFDVAQYNETDHARRIAERFNTDHHELILTTREITDAFEQVAYYADQPFADSSSLAVYHLARMTRESVTVALSGDGGDEAFAGYLRYQLDRWLRIYRVLPLRYAVPALAKLLPDQVNVPTDKNIIAGIKRLEQAASTSHKASIMAWGSYFSEAQKRWLATDSWLEHVNTCDSEALLGGYYDRAQAHSALDRTLAVDFVTYLADDLLVKADRMTMAHSLEVRAPFLDNEVIALGNRLPEKMKIRGRAQKAILREAFADVLPAENTQRIKRGFSIPVSAWLRGHMQSYAREILLDERTHGRGYFRRERVEQLLNDHTSGRADHGQRLWALLALELWQRHYVQTS